MTRADTIRVTGARLTWRDSSCRCALGRAGITPDKHEGDGATPEGCFALRRVLYRADRVDVPATALPVAALGEHDGWCDEPTDSAYNTQVNLPYPARTESLWREDHAYDVIVVLGYNENPVVPGAGSAIFLHLAAGDYAPTGGCVAVSGADLAHILAVADGETQLCVEA